MARRKSDSIEGQLSLFPELEEKPAEGIVAQARPESVQRLGPRLPSGLWLGTSSWSFPGWNGLLYQGKASESRLSRQGLPAYAGHPLLRAVGIDRTYYAPISEQDYRHYADQVPSSFRFLVKAPERLLVARFPHQPRYGKLAGLDNPHYLDAELALEEWVGPAMRGLGSRLGCLLLQFPPAPMALLGGAAGFAVSLHRFLEALPEGPCYAVEVRNRELLAPAYWQVLHRLGASHALNVHPRMPSLSQQYEKARELPGRWTVLRWMLGSPSLPGQLERPWDYEQAVERYAPFDRLVDVDPQSRSEILSIWKDSLERQREVMTIVNNKAEGCSPLSLEALVESYLRSTSQ